jgi:hypothetical protein
MRIRTGVLAAGVLLAFTVGCGRADTGDGVATAGGSGVTTGKAGADGLSDQERMIKYSQCMREHGIDIPDPETAADGGTGIKVPDGVDPKDVEAANKECKQFMPNGGERQQPDAQQLEQQRNFAKCMRENGIPDFPDPAPDGGIGIKPGNGIDPQSPEFKAAQEACAQYQPSRDQTGPGTTIKRGAGK